MTNEDFIKKYSDSFPRDRKYNDLAQWEQDMQSDLRGLMDAARRDEALQFGKFLLRYTPIGTSSDTLWWDKMIGGKYFTTEELYTLFTQQNK